MRRVAASYQQPRTLLGYREHMRSAPDLEGFLEIKIVPAGQNPNDVDWCRRYVALRDGNLYASESSDGEAVELVSLDEVYSVKTVRAVQSKSISSVSTRNVTVYLHAPSVEAMNEWLFSIHRIVTDYLIQSKIDLAGSFASVEDGELAEAVASRLNLVARSRSGDAEDQGWDVPPMLVPRGPVRSLSGIGPGLPSNLNVPMVDDFGGHAQPVFAASPVPSISPVRTGTTTNSSSSSSSNNNNGGIGSLRDALVADGSGSTLSAALHRAENGVGNGHAFKSNGVSAANGNGLNRSPAGLGLEPLPRAPPEAGLGTRASRTRRSASVSYAGTGGIGAVVHGDASAGAFTPPSNQFAAAADLNRTPRGLQSGGLGSLQANCASSPSREGQSAGAQGAAGGATPTSAPFQFTMQHVEDNSLDRVATRDFTAFASISPPRGSPVGSPRGSPLGSPRGSPRASPTSSLSSSVSPASSPRRPSVLDLNQGFGSMSSVDSTMDYIGSPQQRRRASYWDGPSESTKRVCDPPVDFDDTPLNGAASPRPVQAASPISKLNGAALGEGASASPRPTLSSSPVATPGSLGRASGLRSPVPAPMSPPPPPPAPAQVAAEPAVLKAKSGRYIPPHLRKNSSTKPEAPPPDPAPQPLLSPRASMEFDDMDDMFPMENVPRGGALSPASMGHPIYGRTAEQGCRASMEDFDIAFPRFMDRNLGLYGIFDGHCGTRVAELASLKLHEYSEATGRMFQDWPHGAKSSLEHAFQRIEEEFFELATSQEVPFKDGSCAIVAIVHYPDDTSAHADSVAVANLGDSRAVIYDRGQVVAMSEEHSPNRPDERERIENLGGWVTVEREMLIEKIHRVDLQDPLVRERVKSMINYVEISRVNGELAVSRALGDIDYKKPAQDNYAWFFPTDHPAKGQASYTFQGNLVDSTPEWEIHHLSSTSASSEVTIDGAAIDHRRFIIIACDGLWDTITNEEACKVCLDCASPQAASAALVNYAMRMGTSDNVTVQVVALSPRAFTPPPPPPPPPSL